MHGEGGIPERENHWRRVVVEQAKENASGKLNGGGGGTFLEQETARDSAAVRTEVLSGPLATRVQ